MSEPTSGAVCAICGDGNQPQKPLVPPAFEGEAVMCLACLNSPAGIAWRQASRAANPLYDRYIALSTVSLPFECPNCRRPLYVSAKARGMASARWDVWCLRCHRRRAEPMYAFGDTEPAFDALQRVEADFIRGRGLDDIDRRVAAIAQAYDHLINAGPCPCGGRFSLAAKPRCRRCDAVAFDSYFHGVDERNEPARSLA